jgi:hypothetical protein
MTFLRKPGPTRPDQSRQPHDQMLGKVGLDKGFQIAAMQAVRLQAGFINRCVFGDAKWSLEYVYGADEDKGLALDGFEMTDQTLDILSIRLWFTIRDPFLGGGGGAKYGIKRFAFNIADIG